MAGLLNVDREWKHLLKIDATWDFPGSLVVKLHTPNVRLLGLIPSGRTGVPHATQGSQKKKKIGNRGTSFFSLPELTDGRLKLTEAGP